MSRQITREELRNHKDSQGLWIAIHDKVYDVTKFLDEVGVGFIVYISWMAFLHMSVWLDH